MKIRITMKDPDGVYDGVYEACHDGAGISEDGREEIKTTLRTWFEYEEYLTVEVDTETNTIRVLEVD